MEQKISQIQLTPVFVPFKDFVRKTMDSSEGGHGMAIPTDEPWQGAEAVICQMFDKEGTEGLGEVLVWLPETGVSPNQIIDAIENELYKYIIGENPYNIKKIIKKMDNNVARNEVAKGLLDIACHDLMAKLENKPLFELLGGKEMERLPLTALVPLADVRTMKLVSKSFAKSGYGTVRYKLGRNIEEDVEISEAIRSVVGNDTRLRVDYNQAYSPNDAIKAIKAIEPFNIEIAEQPLDKEDFLGLARVQKQVNTPIMVHEGFFSVRDFQVLVELKAVGAAGVNSERPGGVINALKVIDYAEKNGMGTVIHTQPLGIGSAFHIHLAVAKYDLLKHDPEIYGHVMIEDDLLKDSLKFKKGGVQVPKDSGLGIEFDEKKLKKYAVRDSIIIEKN